MTLPIQDVVDISTSAPPQGSPPHSWQVYIIRCSDNSLYTGITTDMERRFCQHAEGRGAKYFRGRQPLKVVYREGNHDRSSAGRREAWIKALKREEKEMLVSEQKSETP